VAEKLKNKLKLPSKMIKEIIQYLYEIATIKHPPKLKKPICRDQMRIPVKKAICSGNKKPLSGVVRFPAVILPGWLFYVNMTASRFTSCTCFMKSSTP
jgi:hypothetical protein